MEIDQEIQAVLNEAGGKDPVYYPICQLKMDALKVRQLARIADALEAQNDRAEADAEREELRARVRQSASGDRPME